jgi:hypothetical protein
MKTSIKLGGRTKLLFYVDFCSPAWQQWTLIVLMCESEKMEHSIKGNPMRQTKLLFALLGLWLIVEIHHMKKAIPIMPAKFPVQG